VVLAEHGGGAGPQAEGRDVLIRAVSLAWGAAYRAHVPEWSESVVRAGMVPDVLEMSGEPLDRPPWILRPRLVRAALEAGSPVLLLDVDARIRLPLDLLPPSADVAAWFNRVAYEPGVSCWNPTAPALAALGIWEKLLAAGIIDDIALTRALRDAGARVDELPPVYCWRRGWSMEGRFGRREPVIEVEVELVEEARKYSDAV
jgi:hypothetical protein